MIDIEYAKLMWHVVIVSLATLGNMEWYKRWYEAGHCDRKCGKRKILALSSAFLAASVAAQMPAFLSAIDCFLWLTVAYNLLTLGNAMIQFAHPVLVKLPEVLLNKAVGAPGGERRRGDDET